MPELPKKKLDLGNFLAPATDSAILDDIYEGNVPPPKQIRQVSPVKHQPVLPQIVPIENDTQMLDKATSAPID